jgi:hypothetical protein
MLAQRKSGLSIHCTLLRAGKFLHAASIQQPPMKRTQTGVIEDVLLFGSANKETFFLSYVLDTPLALRFAAKILLTGSPAVGYTPLKQLECLFYFHLQDVQTSCSVYLKAGTCRTSLFL